MTHKFNKLEIKDELLITRVGKGIKLLKPEQINKYSSHPTGHTISSALQLPLSVYFLDSEGATQKINEEGALICGYGSVDNSIGKSLFEVAENQSANNLINNCKEVMNFNSIKIYDETNIHKDNTINQFLSIKAPWYDDQNKIIGTCGCSIVLGKHSLAESLSHVKQLGLLNTGYDITRITNVTNELQLNNILLSKREMECLKLTIKGYTAKKIAKFLGISHRTVEEYIVNIRLKVGVNSKAELIEIAVDYFMNQNNSTIST